MHPVLFQVGSITIKSYGVAIALAFLVGILFAAWRAKREKLNPNDFLDIGFIIVVSSIVGARVFFILFNLKFYIDNPVLIIRIWEGGLIFYGCLLCAAVASILYMRFKKIPVWYGTDIIAPSVALGYMITRVGCFLNGCCYGKVCDVAWGVSGWDPFTGAGRYAAQFFFAALFGTGKMPDIIKLHPTQLYAAGISLIFFVVLLILWRKRVFDGMVFWSYVGLYSLYRFGIEFVRADNKELFLGLSVPQLMSIAAFVVAVIVMIDLGRKGVLHKNAEMVKGK
ncbi:MAG: prolipoprotein diacylglyceryl transferase [Candidatus Coatesbacteria bacterium]|nr:MAG: prolipoprotein diacylglyceryl transferase [Candidatus Coatesbacteria bacterium]